MNTITPFVILSFDKDYLTEAQTTAAREFGTRKLAHAGFVSRSVVGVYDGVREQSYLVPLPSCPVSDVEEDVHYLTRLAGAFDQDSVLFVDANGLASLHYPDGRPTVFLGQWQGVSAHDIAKLQAWTEIDGRYYVAG